MNLPFEQFLDVLYCDKFCVLLRWLCAVVSFPPRCTFLVVGVSDNDVGFSQHSKCCVITTKGGLLHSVQWRRNVTLNIIPSICDCTL